MQKPLPAPVITMMVIASATNFYQILLPQASSPYPAIVVSIFPATAVLVRCFQV